MTLTPNAAAWTALGRRIRTRRGDEVFVREEGHGPAVLFLHGFPTWSYDWHRQVAALKAEHRCLTLDFLGFGLSDKPRRAYSVFEQADVTEDAASALGVKAVTVVAHDYGDTVLQVLLHRQAEGALPFAIERAVLLNGGVLPRLHRPIPIQRAMGAPVLGPVLSRLVTKRMIRRSFDGIFGDRKIGEAELDDLWSGMALRDGPAISHRLLGYMGERSRNEGLLEGALTRADVPLRFVWGVEDPISGGHVLDGLNALLPSIDALPLGGVGHYPQIEAPEAVTDAIERPV